MSPCHPWALASSLSIVGPPSTVGRDDGGAQAQPSGEVGLEQAPPTSEPMEAQVQRLIAQADGYAKTVEDLAFMVWHGTERCTCDRRHPCERCRQANELLESLGFGERMREWAA